MKLEIIGRAQVEIMGNTARIRINTAEYKGQIDLPFEGVKDELKDGESVKITIENAEG